MLATSADPTLGGRDFDLLIAEHFVQEFKKTFKVSINFRKLTKSFLWYHVNL